ncbi:hypothetical protein SAMN05443633_11411 [Chryseobacterium arachidis]|uniref:C1q domain-containing protein n=1 Tax=Chryseobacterium arachidis TaxID=1416778 RepID=A0A1M5J5Q5_9FLAO|nr:hypothetical protein [Chryseobacterium arachidis]SHG35685.1 hypothetical protein SAMN05443633_11411 [Chryseobacterium arachidis]
MMCKIFIFLCGFIVILTNAQVVIGSSSASQSAMLKLDSGNKALRIPSLSVTNKTDITNPISNPAVGVMLYNTNSDIGNDIAKGITYWSSDNTYRSQATPTSTEEIIASSQIPLLIFSAAIGQKPIIAAGSAAGGSFTNLTLTTAEILFDKYSGWNISTNKYLTPSNGLYMIEFITEMSNTGNNGGTTVHTLLRGASGLATSYGRDNTINNRMYTTTILTTNLTLNDLLTFQYIYTANNYRIQTGTLNIYKYQ